jgi:hypothetical protein
MLTSFSVMFHAFISAAALAAGVAFVSQTRFDLKISGPLTQSGNASDAVAEAPKTAESAKMLFRRFMMEVLHQGGGELYRKIFF